MIRYALRCDDGHRFDSWFADSEACERLVSRGMVACPRCDSVHVSKAIMAPAVVSNRAVHVGETIDRSVPEPASEPVVEPSREQVRAMVRVVRDKILAETTDVGRAFPEEARRIQGGQAEPRRIRGEATLDEARDLVDEGILVAPVPPDPDRLN